MHQVENVAPINQVGSFNASAFTFDLIWFEEYVVFSLIKINNKPDTVNMLIDGGQYVDRWRSTKILVWQKLDHHVHWQSQMKSIDKNWVNVEGDLQFPDKWPDALGATTAYFNVTGWKLVCFNVGVEIVDFSKCKRSCVKLGPDERASFASCLKRAVCKRRVRTFSDANIHCTKSEPVFMAHTIRAFRKNLGQFSICFINVLF